MLGEFEIIKIIRISAMIIVIESFEVNNGWNFTLSKFDWVLDGLEEPFSCNKIR